MISNDNLGPLAEDAAQAAVEHAFGADFVFRAPRKQADGKEVTDVLVLYDDITIILQVKSMEPKASGSWEDSGLRWARKNVAKAHKQTRGAAKYLKRGQPVTMENRRRGRVEFNVGDYPHVLGLVVIHHPPPHPFDAHAFVPDLRTGTPPTHVLSLNDLLELARRLDTPEDLIGYIATRIEVDHPPLNAQVHAEIAAFRYYLENYEELHALRAGAFGEDLSESAFRPAGDFIRAYVVDPGPYKPYGDLFDDLLEKIPEQAPNLGGIQLPDGRIVGETNGNYIDAATALARYPRIKRVALGRRMYKLIREAENMGKSLSFRTYSRRAATSMVVLASPLPQERRGERKQELFELTMLAKQAEGLTRGIGIATEGTIGKGRSYDFIVVEYETESDPEAKRIADELWPGNGRLGDWIEAEPTRG